MPRICEDVPDLEYVLMRSFLIPLSTIEEVEVRAFKIGSHRTIAALLR